MKDIQIYGEPNDTVLDMITQLTQSGVPIVVKPRHLAGFTRASGSRSGVRLAKMGARRRPPGFGAS
jgi:hypothetical protein